MSERGPERKATDAKILRAIKDHYAPAVGTSDIADSVDVARQTVDLRLRDLWEETEYVDSTLVGQSRIWWITSQGERYLAEQEKDNDG